MFEVTICVGESGRSEEQRTDVNRDAILIIITCYSGTFTDTPLTQRHRTSRRDEEGMHCFFLYLTCEI